MIKRNILFVLLLMILPGSQALAADKAWGGHAPPYTFLFGNHIDTHQELFLWQFNLFNFHKGDLSGWFYVFDSGDKTDDGTPILKHCTSPEHYAAGCVAGWRIHARPCIEEVNGCRAMYIYHYHDHPPWLLDPTIDDNGNLRGSRQHIYQPGSYTHMHWLTEGTTHEGTFLPSSIADVESVFGVDIHVPAECNVSTADALTTGAICPGYMLQIFALNPFGYSKWAFNHGGENLIVKPGIDNKTHLNLLTTYQAVVIPQDVLDTLPAYSGGNGTADGSGGGTETGGSGH